MDVPRAGIVHRLDKDVFIQAVYDARARHIHNRRIVMK